MGLRLELNFQFIKNKVEKEDIMNILLIDDDQDSRVSMGEFLRELGHNVVECCDGEEALELFTTDDFPMVLSDIKMPKMTGIELLQAFSTLPYKGETDVVLYTGYGDMESVIAALRAGAYDYLLKPINVEELAAITERIQKHQKILRDSKNLSEGLDTERKAVEKEKQEEMEQLKKTTAKYFGFDKMSMSSETMLQIIQEAFNFHLDRSVPVLIEGEKGTEKEIIARMIHYGIKGDTAPFIEMNCAMLTPDFFESDLFGYEGETHQDEIIKRQKGKLDLAKKGTLFLNAIEQIPIELQQELLRVIDEKEYYRVGRSKKVKADVRMICATHENLEKMVEEGYFQKDLYYRLKVGHIVVPPLRHRKNDVLLLANLFLERFNKQQKKHFKGIGNRAAMMILNYSWPENVWELRNTIKQAVLKHDDIELKPEHLEIFGKEKATEYYSDSTTILDPVHFSLPIEGFDLEQFTNKIVGKALQMHNGNKTDAALYLGISRRSFYSRFKHVEDLESGNNQVND